MAAPVLGDEELANVVAAVRSGWISSLGAFIGEFETQFAEFCGAQHGIAVASGTVALHLALAAAGVGRDDEVLVPSLSFVATANAVTYCGARPVFVDSSAETWQLDSSALGAALTPRTRAIIPVHLYGQPADMDPILEMAKRHGLVVIEDAAQAHGAEYKGRRAGSMGDLGCFSFYPGKNLGAYGEGGIVVTDSSDFTRTLRMLRDWGAEKKYQHVLKGYNYRMEGIQGAVLRVKLRYLERWTEGRRAAAACYDDLLADSGVVTPEPTAVDRHVYHIYAVRTDRRQELQNALHAESIQTGVHYPIPVHLQPAFADLGYRTGCFPHAERAAHEVLSLPMFPELTAEQCAAVAGAVRRLAHAA